jgi:hypothetical protein
MGVEVPQEYGGAGFDAISYALVISEISAADAAHGTIVSVNNSLYGTALVEFGTDQQKQNFLQPVTSGWVNGAYALTEPQSGSDAAAMRWRAILSQDASFYRSALPRRLMTRRCNTHARGRPSVPGSASFRPYNPRLPI